MRTDRTKYTTSIRQAFSRLSERVSTRRGAVGLSLMLHLIVASAFASFLVTRAVVEPHHLANTIEFDLVSEPATKTVANQSESQKSQAASSASAQAGKAEGLPGALARSAQNKNALVMASLASLSDLKESFGFISHQVAADSSSGFAPMHGTDPNSTLNSLGDGKYKDGLGSTGGVTISVGAGVCLPGNQ